MTATAAFNTVTSDILSVDYNTTLPPNATNTTPYDYDYQFDPDPPLSELIPVSFVYGLTLILGIIGNTLVIFSVTMYQRMMTTTNMFLLSLASADLLLVLICVPVKFAAFFSYIWRFGSFLCKAVHYFQNVSAICSVATLTLMSLERFYAIVYPMKAKCYCTVGKARRACVLIWVFSFLLAIPILIGQVHITVGIDRKATWCIKEWSSKTISIIYEVYMTFIIVAIPFAVMMFAYVRICRELWFLDRHRSIMRSESQQSAGSKREGLLFQSHVPLRSKASEDNTTKKQVIKMLVAIIFIFIICWAPITINNLLTAFGLFPPLNVGHFKYIREALFIMCYANSCSNPIVYGFMSKNFRQTFLTSICRCIKGKEYVRRQVFRTQREVTPAHDGSRNRTVNWHSSYKDGNISSETTFAEETDFLERKIDMT